MISERKLLAGTISELIEYFQNLFANSACREIPDNSIEYQLKKLSTDKIGYIFYFRDGVESFYVEMVAIHLREDDWMRNVLCEDFKEKSEFLETYNEAKEIIKNQ